MIRFVTGTDTAVGKTVVSTALAIEARAKRSRVRYFKLVQTGLMADEPGDAHFVAAVAGVPADEGMRFAAPLAPAVAADLEGAKIDTDALRDQALDLAADCDVLIVEGAGGLLVPLSDRIDMAEFASMLEADLVVATRPGLGTLNHTALTVEAARGRGLEPSLVVCDWPSEPGLTETTNLERLKQMAPVLGLVPSIEGLAVETGHADVAPAIVTG